MHQPFGTGELRIKAWAERIQQTFKPSPAELEPVGRDWTGLKVALMLLAVPWTGAAAAYHWLAAVPDAPNCQSPLWSQAEFEQLQCLQAKMQSGETQKLVAGLRTLRAWPRNSPMYTVAQRLLEDWSVVAWSEAQARYEAGQWEDSARLIAEIPEEFELWTQAQQRSTLWQSVREQGDALYQRAQAAIQSQDWQQALGHAQALADLDNDYWRQQGLHKLPLLIEEQQAAAGEAQPLALAPVAAPRPSLPSLPSLPSEGQPGWAADPRSTRPLRSRPIAPILVSLTRPSVAQPGQRPPEFSAA